jgi:hypothetical protein
MDYGKLTDSVVKLVADVGKDPKLKQAIATDPVKTLRARVPDATVQMSADQIDQFSKLVLAGGEQSSGMNTVTMDQGNFLCPACRPTVYAALVAAGIATAVLSGVTGGAWVAAIVSAAVPVVVAATGMTAAAATTAIETTLASLAGKSLNDILNGLADGVCKSMGC